MQVKAHFSNKPLLNNHLKYTEQTLWVNKVEIKAYL